MKSTKPMRSQHGVTLVEMIVAITILAIVGAMAAVFMRRPVQGYVDAANRAELTDKADIALRRIARDLRLALPNSVRLAGTPGGTQYLEFLMTSGGGRYRAELDTTAIPAAPQNVLDFDTADTTFEVIGPMPTAAVGNHVVVYNLFSTGTSANAYAGDNRAQISSLAGNIITITATQFPFPSPSARFQVVTGPVTYECNPTAGQVRRYAGYGIQAAQPTPPAVAAALLVDGVAACSFSYDNAAITATLLRTGVVSMNLNLSQAGESVSLLQQVHVDNVP